MPSAYQKLQDFFLLMDYWVIVHCVLCTHVYFYWNTVEVWVYMCMVCITFFAYPFTIGWFEGHRLVPCAHYCKYCCNEHRGCEYFFETVTLFPSDVCARVELLDHMAILFWIFWGTSTLFSTLTKPFYIPVSSAWGFPFLQMLTSAYCCLFYNSHFHRVLICISLMSQIFLWPKSAHTSRWAYTNIFSYNCLSTVLPSLDLAGNR